jgi:hypothetical protein
MITSGQTLTRHQERQPGLPLFLSTQTICRRSFSTLEVGTPSSGQEGVVALQCQPGQALNRQTTEKAFFRINNLRNAIFVTHLF